MTFKNKLKVSKSAINGFEHQDWPYIIKELTLYTYSRFKFWQLLERKSLKGYSPQEIAMEAIKLVLSGERHWDPSKSELLPFLKFHVVKGLTANLARSKELSLLSEVAEISELDIPDSTSIELNLQAKQVLDILRKKLDGDNLLIGILNGLNDGLKRKEICEMLEIELRSYDNAVRRLRTKVLELKLDKETVSTR